MIDLHFSILILSLFFLFFIDFDIGHFITSVAEGCECAELEHNLHMVSPNRSRSKLEALDSLVISTIHNVSNKLCTSSAAVLRQAALVFPEHDEDKASTLETVIYLLEDLDLPPSPTKKTSRELSGTLRNLKKIEQSMEMMKKLLGPEDEEED